MSKPKYDIDETVICFPEYFAHSVNGTISMITITRKGIRYRVKLGFDSQTDIWEDEIIGKYEDEQNEVSD